MVANFECKDYCGSGYGKISPSMHHLGSHFFHNVITMNVGYFSVKHNSLIDYINWDKLGAQEMISVTKYFKHVRFKKPLKGDNGWQATQLADLF